MKTLINFKSPLFFIAILFSNLSLAQIDALGSLNLDELSAVTDFFSDEGSINALSPSAAAESNSQLQFENTVKQLQRIDDQDLINSVNEKLQKSRIDLAARLCQEDPNACYLIDNYQKYKESDLKKTNENELEVFGIDFFSSYPLGFDQTSVGRVGDNYKISIGDALSLTLYGSISFTGKVVVDTNGAISNRPLPPFQIAGQTLSQAQENLNKFLKTKYVGVSAYISLLKTKGIQVYSVGSIRSPGSFTIAAGSSALNLLVASGGLNSYSSLRDISIVRDDKIVQSIDLYDLLIKGRSSEYDSLMDGDTVLVNSRKSEVKIFGSVVRPAIYELKKEEKLSDILDFALGFDSTANQSNISIKRRNVDGNYVSINTNLEENPTIFHGDVIQVFPLVGSDLNEVYVEGMIRNPGMYSYFEGMQLSDLIDPARDITDLTYLGFGVVMSYNIKNGANEIKFFDLLDKKSLESFLLKPLDKIFIFSKADIDFINSNLLKKFVSSDDNFINFSKNLLDASEYRYPDVSCMGTLKSYGGGDFLSSIKSKTTLTSYKQDSVCTELLNKNPSLIPLLINNSVVVTGNVQFSGIYPAAGNVSARFVFDFAGGYTSSRDQINPQFEVGFYDQSFKQVELNNLESTFNYYSLNVKSASKIFESGFINLVGEFKFPGSYPINSSTTLTDIYKRAGGLTSEAFPLGGILTRSSIKEKEELTLRKVESELTDILTSAVTSGIIETSPAEVLTIIEAMKQVENAQATGRLVTEFNPQIILKDKTLDTYLQPGDTIYMPKIQNTVTIMGSVLNPITVPYKPNMGVKKYIDLAGGLKDSADSSRIYLVYPDGSATPVSSSRFAFNSSTVLPGSSIIVSREARPLSGLSLVEAISPILANLSITLASINSISNN